MKYIKKLLIIMRYIALRLIFPTGMKPEDVNLFFWHMLPIKMKDRRHEITLMGSLGDKGKDVPATLLEIVIKAVVEAQKINLDFLDIMTLERSNLPLIKDYVEQGGRVSRWPGEHYRLLAALVRVLDAKNIVEIGTYCGLSALALKEGLKGRQGHITTFDIIRWNDFSSTYFKDTDFDSQLSQIVGDLQDAKVFASHKTLFEEADLIFMDAAKDGIMERKFLESFSRCSFHGKGILLIDDIHTWNMLDIWDEIEWPKLDITCFGHYSGTGIVALKG